MRYDAYAGNVPDAVLGHVAEGLAWSLKGVVCQGKRIRRYGETLAVDVGGRTAVWLGRDDANGCIYFEGKGETTPDLVRGVRAHFPAHSVARADVCEDYDSEGAFASLQALVRAHKGLRVKAGYVALPDDPEEGKTWTAGVRGGVSMVRVYESGKHPDRVHLGRPNLVRVELEARPHYARDKLAVATMQPLEVWGLSAWTHSVAGALTQVEIPRYQQETHLPSVDKTTSYLARTFRRYWQERMSEGRDWACIGREFEAVWKQDDELPQLLAQQPDSGKLQEAARSDDELRLEYIRKRYQQGSGDVEH